VFPPWSSGLIFRPGLRPWSSGLAFVLVFALVFVLVLAVTWVTIPDWLK
jgi:hypothetical protein